MAQRTDIFSLGRMGLTSGEGRRLELHAALAPLELGGERYTPDRRLVPVRLDISRTTGNGYALRLRFAATLTGPCMRCLGPGRAALRDRRARGQPARRRRRGPALALRRRRRRPRPRAPGRATPSRSPCPPRSRARPTAAACARAAARTSTRTPSTPTRPSPTALGEALRDPLRLDGARWRVGGWDRYPSRRPWPSPSRSSRTRAPTSAGRSTRSPRRSLNECPQCHRRAARTACAPTAASTRVARSSRCSDAHDHDHDH